MVWPFVSHYHDDFFIGGVDPSSVLEVDSHIFELVIVELETTDAMYILRSGVSAIEQRGFVAREEGKASRSDLFQCILWARGEGL